jgi:choline dehydrogenase-like flavoprotein
MKRQQYDVVIIGSGAGGAPIAHTIATTRPDLSVLVIDKGPLFFTQYQSPDGLSDFKRDEMMATGTEKRINLPGVANNGNSYYNSHVEPDINDEPHIYRDRDGRDKATIEGYTAQVVGGGTQIYGAVSLRFAPNDFKLKTFNDGRTDLKGDPNGEVQREARDWPVSYEEMEPYYCKAEELIGISGTQEGQTKPFSKVSYHRPLPPNPISRYVETGMDALGMKRYRTPLAVITEDHPSSGRQGFWNELARARQDQPNLSEEEFFRCNPKTGFVNRYGDAMGYKSSTWVSLLWPIYNRPNFELSPNTHVTHLESQGDRVSRVWYRNEWGQEGSVEGRLVIVACSAIESVRLLMLSAEQDGNFANRIHQGKSQSESLLGKYFLTHCFGGAQVVTPDAWDKSLSVDSDWATDFCATDDFVRANGLWAGGAIYNNTSDEALPISMARTRGAQDMDNIWRGFVDDNSMTGQRMHDYLKGNLGKRISLAFMANQVPLRTNRIELHPTITDKWGRKSAYIIKDWHSHDRTLMDIFAGQCRNILRYLDGMGNYNVNEFGSVYQAENGIVRIANHILGGARFGTDRNDSVLDRDCRAWQFDNLYVTDGCFMPTSGGANPTLTIQANSFRVADHLLDRLRTMIPASADIPAPVLAGVGG